MKIYYVNDENIPVTVQINAHQVDPMKWDHITYETLQPQEAKMFEFLAPDDAIPYIKKWNRRNQVLLTYIESKNLPKESV